MNLFTLPLAFSLGLMLFSSISFAQLELLGSLVNDDINLSNHQEIDIATNNEFSFQQNAIQLEGVSFGGDFYPSPDGILVAFIGGLEDGEEFGDCFPKDGIMVSASTECTGSVQITFVETRPVPEDVDVGGCCFRDLIYQLTDDCGNSLEATVRTDNRPFNFRFFSFFPPDGNLINHCSQPSINDAGYSLGDVISVSCQEDLSVYESLIVCAHSFCNGSGSGKFRRARRSFKPGNCFRETWDWGVSEDTGEPITLTFEFDACADINISDAAIPTTTYFAEQNIISTGQLADGADVRFIAGNTITLSTGFSTELGDNFTAEVRAINTCNSGTNSRSLSNEEVNQNTTELQMDITPNPATNMVNIHYNLPKNVNRSQLHLLNANGQYLQSLTLSNNQKQVNLSLMERNSGLYFLQLQTDAQVLTKKLSILR